MLELLPIINNNGLAFIILAMILFASLHRRELTSVQNRLFIALISLNLLLAVVDTLGWFFNTRPGQLNFWLNNISNSLLYILAPLPAAVWLLYVFGQTGNERSGFRRLVLLLTPLLVLNLLIALFSMRFNLYYHISEANIYARGPLFYLHVLISYLHIIASWVLTIRRREAIDKRQFWAIIIYPVPIIIGSVLQVIWYGLALNWITMSISVLLVFIHLENRGLNTDHLTGIFNRRHIEQVIRRRIKRADSDQSFALILADLDSFKKINDLYGHKTGDEALVKTADLISCCLRQQDQVARIGGDEFYIVLDLDDRKSLEKVVGRIERAFREFNDQSPFKWELHLSMGAAIYDPDSRLSAEEFLSYVDRLMYKEKARRRQTAEYPAS